MGQAPRREREYGRQLNAVRKNQAARVTGETKNKKVEPDDAPLGLGRFDEEP